MEETLKTPHNAIPGTSKHPSGRFLEAAVHRRYRRDARLFSYHTRYYLRRRAWRTFADSDCGAE